MLGFLNRTTSTIHSAALILGAAGFLSRLLGLLRDRMLAGTFGAGPELDAYYAAFQIPDFVYTILLLGAGSMAILPIFVEALNRNREEAERFINSLVTFFSIVTTAIIAVGILIAPVIVKILFPGFTAENIETVIFLTRIIFISPLFLGISGILTSPLQVFHKFIAYALSSILYNVGIILGIIAFVPLWGVRGLAFGVIIGALLHCAVQLYTYRSLKFSLSFVRDWWNGSVREVLSLSFPRVLALSLRQLMFVILFGLASTLHPGSISIFQFAQNLGFLPVGIFAVSYATAFFPRLSQHAVERNAKEFFEDIFFSIRTVAFWIIPIAFLSAVLRAHIVRVALGAGAFDWSDTRLTAAAFAILIVALIGESFTTLLLRGFYALKETWLPLWISLASMIVSVGGAFGFLELFRSFPLLAEVVYEILRVSDVAGGEVLAVTLGASVGILLNGALFFVFLVMRAKRQFNLGERTFAYRRMVVPLLKIVVASVGAGAVSYYSLAFLSNFYTLDKFSDVFIEGLLAGIAGIGVYVLILYSLRSEDLFVFARSLRKQFFNLGILPEHWNGDKTSLEQ